MCGICLVIDGVNDKIRRELFLALCSYDNDAGLSVDAYDASDDVLERCLSEVARRGPTVPGGQYSFAARCCVTRETLGNEILSNKEENGCKDESQKTSTLGIHLYSSVLHLRGEAPESQPLTLKTSRGTEGTPEDVAVCLLWNGEVFGGRVFSACEKTPNSSDTHVLGQFLLDIHNKYTKNIITSLDSFENEVLEILDDIDGPFSIVIYFAPPVNQLWITRDKIGRRSLCLIDPRPTSKFGPIVVASVGPSFSTSTSRRIPYMAEIGVTGVAIVELDSLVLRNRNTSCPNELNKLNLIVRILKWITPAPYGSNHFWTSVLPLNSSINSMKEEVLISLEAILLRAIKKRLDIPNPESIALLFSGGVDSSILLSLILRVLPAHTNIDLLSVAFGDDPLNAPDRFTALSTYREILSSTAVHSSITPKELLLCLVCIDVSKDEIKSHELRICSLLHPKNSHMDFNIGVALYFASRGIGFLVRPDFDKNENSEWWDCYTEMCLPANIEKRRLGRILPKLSDVSTEQCSNCLLIKKPGCSYGLCRLCCERQRRNTDRLEHCKVHFKVSVADKNAPKAVQCLYLPLDCEDSLPFSRRCNCCQANLIAYSSKSPILFSGHGADELFGGYGRHATAGRHNGDQGAKVEMIKDLSRLWERNLGRDDRCVSSWGKEIRHPFLDEDVIRFVGDLPFDMLRCSEEEDKPLLRSLARRIGLISCAEFKKRAIQFGTRSARQTNKDHFPSNRKAKAPTSQLWKHAKEDTLCRIHMRNQWEGAYGIFDGYKLDDNKFTVNGNNDNTDTHK